MKAILFKFTFLLFVIWSCDESLHKDETKPEIDLSIPNAFPTNCSTLNSGEDFNLVIGLKDDVELGSYSIQIHNDFDGHSHTTEREECEDEKDHDNDSLEIINPFTFVQNYPLEDGLKNFTTNTTITIPSDVDKGPYHFTITVIDKNGWQTLKILSVHID